MNWLSVRELIRKEFIQLFRDKKNRPILIITPLIQLLIFGYVVNYDIKNVRVALWDQSRTAESRLVLDGLRGSRIFTVMQDASSDRELEKLLVDGDVDMGINIPPDFSSRIRRRETAPIQVLADGSMSNMASMRIA
jgi:ABC-2 type transport system permease protein